MVTGRGLAGAFHHKLPRPLIAIVACALFIANTANVGVDLSGMADAAQMFVILTRALTLNRQGLTNNGIRPSKRTNG